MLHFCSAIWHSPVSVEIAYTSQACIRGAHPLLCAACLSISNVFLQFHVAPQIKILMHVISFSGLWDSWGWGLYLVHLSALTTLPGIWNRVGLQWLWFVFNCAKLKLQVLVSKCLCLIQQQNMCTDSHHKDRKEHGGKLECGVGLRLGAWWECWVCKG